MGGTGCQGGGGVVGGGLRHFFKEIDRSCGCFRNAGSRGIAWPVRWEKFVDGVG